MSPELEVDEATQHLWREVGRFLSERMPPDQLHRLIAAGGDTRWDRTLWDRVVQMGWTALAVPEAKGGVGANHLAVAGVAEALGHAAFPSPLGETLAASHVLRGCETDAANALLERVAEGLPLALALDEPWVDEPFAVTFDGDALRGSAPFVQEAPKAEAYVVAARTDAGAGLYLVERGASGLTLTPDRLVDLTREQGTLHFDGVTATELAPPGRADAIHRATEPARLVLLAADMVGAAEWQLTTTAEYARTRMQFGRAVGSFQAVKHPLVDLMVQVDQARSLVWAAAHALDMGADDARLLAHMAKSRAGDAARFGSSRSVQLHGGIGFTWECQVQLWFKRQEHSRRLLGNGAHHRARVAELLLDGQSPASSRAVGSP